MYIKLLLGALLLPLMANSMAFTIHNNSPAYINSQTGGCPTLAPGDSATTSEYWCGYIACSSSSYKDGPGCMERISASNSHRTQGGYLGWFSISLGSNTCTVSGALENYGTNPYSCKYDQSSGEFTWNYQSLTQYYTYGSSDGRPVVLPKPTFYGENELRGTNISGLEYNGTYGDAMYQMPDLPDVKYFVEQGMNTVRLPIRLEYLYADHNGNKGKNLADSHLTGTQELPPYTNTIYTKAITDITSKYLASGLYVIIDLHDYMRFCPTGNDIGQGNEPTSPVENNCTILTQAQISDIWTNIAANFKQLAIKYPDKLLFGIANEPFGQVDQPLLSDTLYNNEIAAIKAIRNAGIKDNSIILSGNYWDPLHGWKTDYPKDASSGGDSAIPNSELFTKAKLKESGINTDNLVMEVHQYLDQDYSGRSSTCRIYNSYEDFESQLKLTEFSTWMQDNDMKGMLTEFGAADNANCQKDLNYLLQFVTKNQYSSMKGNGFIGWTAWRANRHAPSSLDYYGAFNYLNQADYTVYGGSGTLDQSQPGTGIAIGLGNANMAEVFAQYLTPAY